jgi:hypothetical protein
MSPISDEASSQVNRAELTTERQRALRKRIIYSALSVPLW